MKHFLNSLRNQAPQLLLLVAAGLVFGLPCLLYGFPFYGDDSIQHAIFYSNFSAQLAQGDLYPRWLYQLNGGLGSPAFYYYSPLPFYLTSLLRPFFAGDDFGWRQLGLGAVLALVCSGLSFYSWLKSHVRPLPAAFAAIVYMALPYHLDLDLYYRGAYAEFWTFVWLPWVLYFVDGVLKTRRYAALGLALIYAFLIMTHLPTSLIFSPVIVAYSIVFSPTGQWKRVCWNVLGGMLLGVGLAAIYLVPALALKKFVFLSEGTIGHYHYSKWFLFVDVTWLARKEIFWSTIGVMVLACLAFAASWHSALGAVRRQAVFWITTAALTFFMMTSISKPLWAVLPFLREIQFPWRFNVLLSLAAAALLGFAFTGRPAKTLYVNALTLTLALLIISWTYSTGRRAWYAYPIHYIDPAVVAERERWLEQRRDQNERRPRWVKSIREPDLDELLKSVGKAATVAGVGLLDGPGTVSVSRWDKDAIVLDVNAVGPSRLTVSQLYFPGWEARLDGTQVLEVGPSTPDGLVSITVPAGVHEVRLRRVTTGPERVGQILSLVSVLLLLGTAWRVRHQASAVAKDDNVGSRFH